MSSKFKNSKALRSSSGTKSQPRGCLSCWNDTLGPRTVFSWNMYGDSRETRWNAEEQSVQRFSLLEEIHTPPEELGDKIKFKMQVLQNQGLLCMCTTFRAQAASFGSGERGAFAVAGQSKEGSRQLIPSRKSKASKRLTLYCFALVWKIDTVDESHSLVGSECESSEAACDSEEVHGILSVSDVLKTQLQEVSAVLRDLLKDNPHHLHEPDHPIHSHMNTFLTNVNVLTSTPPIHHHHIDIHNTLFAHQHHNHHHYSHDFINKAITAHLQMHGKTVVLGSNHNDINLWLNSLALFVPQRDLHLCRYVHTTPAPSSPSHNNTTTPTNNNTTDIDISADTHTVSSSSPPSSFTSLPTHIHTQQQLPEYIPELWLQGLCIPSDFKINKKTLSLIFSPLKVMQSPYPFCILDIENKTVRTLFKYNQLIDWKTQFRDTQADQYSLIVSSTNQKKAMLKKHKSRPFNLSLGPLTPTFSRRRSASISSDSSTVGTPLPESNFTFQNHSAISYSVSDLFEQLRALPSHMRKGWICEYMRQIQRKAVLLCKLLEQILIQYPRTSQLSDQVQRAVFDWIRTMDESFCSEERKKTLPERDESQMEILVASAQKMTPHNIYSLMNTNTYGDFLKFWQNIH